MVEPDKNLLLKAALEYHRRGWCIIPIATEKKPPKGFKWKRYQTERSSEANMREWFSNGKYNSLAVICGAVSGGLAILDLDSQERCQWWNKEHSNLANVLSTVKTKRGLHIYFRSEPFRKQNGDNVDLLCEGAYAVLPPSPDKEWLIPLDGELPLLNPFEWGLEQFGIETPDSNLLAITPDITGFKQDVTERIDENRRELRKFKEIELLLVKGKIKKIITETLPKMIHTRHRQVFALARGLWSIPEYTDADPKQFRLVVVEWHKRALHYIETKEFEETWIDFLKGWDKIKWKIGENPMTQIFEKVMRSKPPRIAIEKYPDNSNLKKLVSLCRELQQASGDNPFFLSARTTGKLFNVAPMTASRWFFLLETDGILKVVSRGKLTQTRGIATRFRYIAN
jgi:hypothetical protein